MNFVRKGRNIQPQEKDENEPKNCLSNLKMLHIPQSPDRKESVIFVNYKLKKLSCFSKRFLVWNWMKISFFIFLIAAKVNKKPDAKYYNREKREHFRKHF